jgi:hypothetical protein
LAPQQFGQNDGLIVFPIVCAEEQGCALSFDEGAKFLHCRVYG